VRDYIEADTQNLLQIVLHRLDQKGLGQSGWAGHAKSFQTAETKWYKIKREHPWAEGRRRCWHSA
jgi:hypothetical protein